MKKEELNNKLAELYEDKCLYITPLIDNSARMFDLMLKHNLLLDFAWVNFGGCDLKYYTARLKCIYGGTDMVFLKDHESESAAARFAIAMALVKLAESE